MNLSPGKFAKHSEPFFYIRVAVSKCETHIRGKRRRIETRNEYRLGRVLRVRNNAVWPLNNAWPQPRRQHKVDHLFARGRSRNIELPVSLLLIRFDLNVQYSPFVAAVDSQNGSADGRGDEYLRPFFIEKQRASGLDPLTRLHQQLRCKPREV